MSAVGYSGTPLARKLGMKGACRVYAIDAPPEYRDWLEPLPDVIWLDGPIAADVIHLFCTDRDRLQAQLLALQPTLGGALWVSWPKKASRQPTTITEDVIRALALPLGLVDVKVCAVSDVWSGLKLVVRKELR